MAIISITSTSVAVNPLKQSQPVGATLAFLGLQGMMPMLHGSPGCSAFTKVVLTKHLGKVFPLSSTAMTEVSTILGGEENIEKAIAKLVQISQPKMIGICTTGLTETRGDDMGRLLKDMRQRYSELSQVPIYLVSTPDFKGTLQDGFAAAVKVSSRKFRKRLTDKIVVPSKSLFWLVLLLLLVTCKKLKKLSLLLVCSLSLSLTYLGY